MALPAYEIVVIGTDGVTKRIFGAETFDEMRYSRLLDGIGKIALTLRDTEDYSLLFPLDTFIEVYRNDPTTGQLAKEDTYFTRLVHHFVEGDETFWVIGGVSLNHLLKRRIIDPDDDPNVAGGYSTKGGAADTIIREYIREQAADLASSARQFPSFTVPAVAGTADSAGYRARFENLFEIIQQLSRKGNTDFIIERTTSNNLECTIGLIGSDLSSTLIITPGRQNIRNPSYLEDRTEEANFVYALGEGQGTNRTVLKIQASAVSDSPYNRIEYIHDARNAEDALELLTEGQGSFEEHRGEIKFDFEMSEQVAGTSYRVDWDVGDKITGKWDTVSKVLRVVGVEVDLGADGETVTPILEETGFGP